MVAVISVSFLGHRDLVLITGKVMATGTIDLTNPGDNSAVTHIFAGIFTDVVMVVVMAVGTDVGMDTGSGHAITDHKTTFTQSIITTMIVRPIQHRLLCSKTITGVPVKTDDIRTSQRCT